MDKNMTSALVDFVLELSKESLPNDIVKIVNDCILDYVGVTCAGSAYVKENMKEYIELMQDAKQISPIGMDVKCSMTTAALINGMSAHYFELDDGSRFGMIHLGAPIISAALPIAYKYDVKRSEFVKAILIGYEVALRLAEYVQPSHKKKGFHATGTCSCIGAAVTVACLLKQNSEQLRNTVAVAVASMSGLLTMIDEPSTLKIFNAGKAAQNAIEAAFVGQVGYRGSVDVIKGKRGFAVVMATPNEIDPFDRSSLDYSIRKIYRKKYTSCRHCHPAIESALELKRGEVFDVDMINHVTISTYDLSINGHDQTLINTPETAKMSIPYNVAAALNFCEDELNNISEETIKNPDITRILSCTEVVENVEFSKLVPGKRCTEVILKLDDGRVISRVTEYPKGEPENPLSDEELRAKYYEMMSSVWQDKAEEIEKAIYDEDKEINHLLEILCK